MSTDYGIEANKKKTKYSICASPSDPQCNLFYSPIISEYPRKTVYIAACDACMVWWKMFECKQIAVNWNQIGDITKYVRKM